MSDNVKKPTVMALGYFDSVHEGHKKVIKTAKEFADKNGYTLTVFTFKGNLKGLLNGDGEKSVYLPKEREKFLFDLGADEIYFAPVDFNFLSTAKLAFLNKLNKKYNIKCYVSGADYRFGKFGKGDITDLKRYAENNNQAQIVVDTFTLDGQKVSTTAIKKFLVSGDIKKANVFLGRNYSVTGKVFKDREVGSTIGFPTANIKLESDKFCIKDGVYAGFTEIGGKVYKAIINYGARPTFNLKDKLIEAHIDGFDGNLYGQEITLEFTSRIRDVKKFNGEADLKEQLEKDLKGLKDGIYD